MSLATREQKAVMTDFAGAGPFGPLGRPKDMIERLEENISKQSRLRTDVEYKYRRRNVHTEFLSRVVCISLPLKGTLS